MCKKLTYLIAVLLLSFLPVLILGCASERETPVPAEPPAEVPVTINDKYEEAISRLAPEKTTILSIEGMEEEIILSLEVSSLYPYAIYLDEERYVMAEKDGKEFISPRAEGADPALFMTIRHEENVDLAAVLGEIEDQLKEEYADVTVQGWVESPLRAQYLYAVNGNTRDDQVERYYLAEDSAGGVFIIQQMLFLEAMEGHGARFDGMLEEFIMLK